MIADLLPHQRDLVELVTDSSRRQAIALLAPPQTGAQTALAEAVVTIARRGGLVVVVTHRLVVLEQWVELLEAEQVTQIQVLRGGWDLRLALSRGITAWPAQGVIVATDRSLGSGTIARKVDLDPKLLVLDSADEFPSDSVATMRRLQERSQTSIARVHSSSPAWFAAGSIVEWLPSVVVPDRGGRYTIQRVGYEIEAGERELILEAAEFVRAIGAVVPPESLNRRGVQRVLASLEAATTYETSDTPGLTVDERQRIADLLERFDDLDDDPRLETLVNLVRSSRQQGRPCVVVVELRLEVSHVLDYLRDAIGDVQVLTSTVPPDQRLGIRDALAGGATVVATEGMIEYGGEDLPDDTVNIWWDLPRTIPQAQARVGVGFASSGVEVKVPLPDPPLSSERFAFEDLEAGSG